MSFKDIGNAIKSKLRGIGDLQQVISPSELQETINALPCAVIMPEEFEYHSDQSSNIDYRFRVIVLFSKTDLPAQSGNLLDYLEQTGERSVKQVLETDPTLDGNVDHLKVSRCSGIGFTTWGDIQYLSTEFNVWILA